MSIHFLNKELKRIIECRPIGNFYPFNLEEYQDEAIDALFYWED